MRNVLTLTLVAAITAAAPGLVFAGRGNGSDNAHSGGSSNSNSNLNSSSGNSGNSSSSNSNSGNSNAGGNSNANSNSNSGNANSGNANSGNPSAGASNSSDSGNPGVSGANLQPPGLTIPDGGGHGPPSSSLFTACALGDIGPGASACQGWFHGNLNSGNAEDAGASADALNDLLGVGSYTGDSLSWLKNLGSISGGTVDFGRRLYGQTVVSFHVGGAVGAGAGVGYEGRAFYQFDAGAEGLDTFAFNLAGLSNARLYSTGEACEGLLCGVGGGGGGGGGPIPEPATWTMMIGGFFGMGALLRRRRVGAAPVRG